VSRLAEEWLTAPHIGVVITGLVVGFGLPTAICYSVPSTG
jgi:hypothetical protein